MSDRFDGVQVMVLSVNFSSSKGADFVAFKDQVTWGPGSAVHVGETGGKRPGG